MHRFKAPGSSSGSHRFEESADLLARAWNEEDPFEQIELVMAALARDPENLDAQCLLCELLTATPGDEIDDLKEVIQKAEMKLGPEMMKEFVGNFLMISDTRPYMRARRRLADLYMLTGRREEAIAAFQDMLRLNPNDDQGVRNDLVRLFLQERRFDDLAKLAEQFHAEESAIFLWAEVLAQFIKNDIPRATAALQNARKQNKFVTAFLTGEADVPEELPEGFVPGDQNEALIVLDLLDRVWRKAPGALEWLESVT